MGPEGRHINRLKHAGKSLLLKQLPDRWVQHLSRLKNGKVWQAPSARKAGTSASGKSARTSDIRVLEQQNASMTAFLGRLAEAPWMGNSLSEGLLGLHSQQPSLVMSLASGLLREPYSEKYGLLALIKIQYKRKIFSYVAQLAERYPQDQLIADAFEEAAMSYAAVRSPHCAPLVRSFLQTLPQDPALVAASGELKSRAIIAMQAAILAQDAPLLADVLARLPDAGSDQVTPGSYALLRLQAEDWLARFRKPIDSIARPGSLRIGVLGYGSPLKPSTNIGDFIQTIALMGLMARSLPEDVKLHGGGEDVFGKIRARVPRRKLASKYDKVDAVWIDRDDTSTTPDGGTIWLPVNGWFMHPKVEDQYDFPFASNVRPIFIGMHINKPQMLTPETVAYLKRYAPIGARDYHTAELLMSNGIDAFFNGCPTLTLDNIFGRTAAGERTGTYYAAHKPGDRSQAARKQMIHMDPAMPTWSKDRGLESAWNYVSAYAKASDVVTPLLHCYLPCRALGTKVQFTNPNAATDVRFEGLIGISEQERDATAARITANVDAVMELILSGASEEEVYARWRERNAAEVAKMRERLRKKTAELDLKFTTAPSLQNFPKKSFRNGIEGPAPKPGGKFVDVVFCYDQNFDRPTFTTLRSMLANTKSPVRVTLLTRGLAQNRIEAISRAFPDCDFVWLDVTEVKFANLKLLRHTTLSTMDRLFLPLFLDYTDRVAYLDIDIVILGDIKDLYDFDLGGHPLGARVTVFPGWSNGYSLGALIEKQLTPAQIKLFRRQFMYGEPLGYACFNAGVQLLDLKKLRDLKFTEKLLQIVDTYGVNDQFACNLFAAGKFAHIPYEWNHFATQEWIDQPKLIHYTGYIKPWDAEYCPKAELWRQYIDPADGLERMSATAKSWFK